MKHNYFREQRNGYEPKKKVNHFRPEDLLGWVHEKRLPIEKRSVYRVLECFPRFEDGELKRVEIDTERVAGPPPEKEGMEWKLYFESCEHFYKLNLKERASLRGRIISNDVGIL